MFMLIFCVAICEYAVVKSTAIYRKITSN